MFCRKPEPGFYLLACNGNGIEPQQAVFLDDLGLCVSHFPPHNNSFMGRERQNDQTTGLIHAFIDELLQSHKMKT